MTGREQAEFQGASPVPVPAQYSLECLCGPYGKEVVGNSLQILHKSLSVEFGNPVDPSAVEAK